MIIIIPIGGIGKRFREHGYVKPKALIPVLGKPILFWLLDCIRDSDKNIQAIYIPHTKEYTEYNLKHLISHYYPSLNVICQELANKTRGALETIALCLMQLNIEDSPIMCLDSDNFYRCDILSAYKGNNTIVTFDDNHPEPIYSYVITDETYVTNIVEKVKVSDTACTGAYAFRSWKMLMKESSEMIYQNSGIQKGEFYTSGCIQSLIEKGEHFDIINVKPEEYFCLGTPLQIRLFCSDWTRALPQKRFCFDLDMTLVTTPQTIGDYRTVQPINKNIEMLRYLYSLGHYIIIYTARRMKTHSGSVGKVVADIGKITFDTLNIFDIPYHEIYFGKPYADYYIDDKAIDACCDLDNALGYYRTTVKARNFHKVSKDTMDIYKKEGKDLSGEIQFYLNIPDIIQCLFPIMLDYDKNYKSYVINRIHGLTASSMFVAELLQPHDLESILMNLGKIHSCGYTDMNIYANYAEKIHNRYEKNKEVYIKLADSVSMYQELMTYFKDYETRKGGVPALIIHGDPVFTNIIIDKHRKNHFIDPRGKLGNVCTTSGDALYDFAKIYQSIMGYDEVLLCKKVTHDYREIMLSVFKNFIETNFDAKTLEIIKKITKGLFFTLMPLHEQDDKIQLYYKIAKKL